MNNGFLGGCPEVHTYFFKCFPNKMRRAERGGDRNAIVMKRKRAHVVKNTGLSGRILKARKNGSFASFARPCGKKCQQQRARACVGEKICVKIKAFLSRACNGE